MIASGVDLTEIERLKYAIDQHGERFLARIFTPKERDLCGARIERLAGRFAVKEAVTKALGTGIGAVSWLEIEVLSDELGKPVLTLSGSAETLAAKLGLTQWSVSISHTAQHAIGFAIAIGD